MAPSSTSFSFSPLLSTAPTKSPTAISPSDLPDIHGLSYPPDFLPALHVLLPRPPPHEPIRAISAVQFAQIHLRNLFTHAPDSTLFPFLHGLEGENEAQNSFFRSYGGHGKRTSVPKYRGLIWVACDDEDVGVPQSYQSSPVYSDDDLDDDDFSSSEIECDDEPEVGTFAMDIDTSNAPNTDIKDKGVHAHMHPVHHRTHSMTESTTPIYAVDYAYSASHDRRASNASSFSASSIDSPASTSFSAETSFTSDPSSSLLKDDSIGPHLDGFSPDPAPATPSPTPPPPTSSLLTSSFRASELLVNGESGPELLRPRVPDGISLRNFGIQVPIYASLSDVVIYSPKGATRAAFALAEKFKLAIEAKMVERMERLRAEGDDHPEKNLVAYNVFVLTATLPEMLECLPHLLSRFQDTSVGSGQLKPLARPGAHTDGPDAHVSKEDDRNGTILKANTINFAQREKDEMRDLTKASEILSTACLPDHLAASSPSAHWDPTLGQIFLGNANDIPIADEWVHSPQSSPSTAEDPFDYSSNDPTLGHGFDICIECHDLAPFPSSAHVRAADEHLAVLDATWAARYSREDCHEIPIRPPPNANSVVHLSFPSSPPSHGASVNALAPFVAFLDRWLRMPGVDAAESATPSTRKRGMTFSPSSLPPPTSFTNTFFCTGTSGSHTRVRSTSASYSPYGNPSSYHPRSQATVRTRPMKILIYSSDGYTESSVLALCLLMAMRGLSLPHAYLELQVVKKRSFFVYQSDLGLLKRVEAKLAKDRGSSGTNSSQYLNGVDAGTEVTWNPGRNGERSVANSISGNETRSVSTQVLTSEQQPQYIGRTYPSGFRRPRASTMPMMPAFTDHQSWFNDPRFNGSFPSRVLPFLYLGDLNHASNVYMLHALGITHVVSVGECALVPPPEYPTTAALASDGACNNGAGSHKEHASLWMEEREGRIKVLDIQGVCDDGIDTLEPQLEPICNWIEKARMEGGNVLVHCRVGVSRSATVTIAYVMKHLALPLVDAYLIVRSRRLSVLIQPNMRLLYNLLGWEVKLAKERAGDNEERLKAELARCLNWPYLAREVHALNEKYLH